VSKNYRIGSRFSCCGYYKSCMLQNKCVFGDQFHRLQECSLGQRCFVIKDVQFLEFYKNSVISKLTKEEIKEWKGVSLL
jgi:hypothetical protein